MRVSQAVFGVFHHFELAHQLRRYDYLDTVYSTYPWRRLQREGLPHEYVQTFPWIHGGLAALARFGLYPSPWTEGLDWWNALAFDKWMTRRIARSKAKLDALIGISGAGLTAGALVQSHGGKYICDRGSTHARYQWRLLSEEHQHWDAPLDIYDPRDTEREEKQYDQADCIVVPSSFAARSFVAEGIAAEKLHVIPYGVRLDSFQPSADVSAPDRHLRSFVCWSGQPEERRALFAGGIRKSAPSPQTSAHSRPDVPPHEAAISANLPMENVEIVGAVSRAELVRYFSRSHAMVLPSLEEGLALVQGEAMACGCPVIATPNTGSEDLFTDGKEGFVVPPRDAVALADRLQQLADDPALQQRMSAAALDRVQHLGGWNAYGDRWAQLLRQVCTPPSSGAQEEKPS